MSKDRIIYHIRRISDGKYFNYTSYPPWKDNPRDWKQKNTAQKHVLSLEKEYPGCCELITIRLKEEVIEVQSPAEVKMEYTAKWGIVENKKKAREDATNRREELKLLASLKAKYEED